MLVKWHVQLCKRDIFNKSLKASNELNKYLSGSSASTKTNLPLLNHAYNSIILYGSEI